MKHLLDVVVDYFLQFSRVDCSPFVDSLLPSLTDIDSILFIESVDRKDIGDIYSKLTMKESEP